MLKNSSKSKKPEVIESLQHFKELYLPNMLAEENMQKNKNDEDYYAKMIAMLIIEGIKKDLSSLNT